MALTFCFACKPVEKKTESEAKGAPKSSGPSELKVDALPADASDAALIRRLVQDVNVKNASFDPKLDGSTFTVVHLWKVEERMALWNQTMPGVAPFYAVKANPDERIVSKLCSLGASFDVASRGEIETVNSACKTCCTAGNKECCVERFPSRKMVYANPRKERSDIVAALGAGVKRMTLDSMHELEKMHAAEAHARRVNPDLRAEYVLRLKAGSPSESATIDFSAKFGATEEEAGRILERASRMDPKPEFIGVSFHVGSNTLKASAGSAEVDSLVKGVSDAYEVHLTAARNVLGKMREYGHKPTFVDTGGGWLGANDEGHRAIAAKVSAQIEDFKSREPGVTFVAEPGRFFSTQAATIGIRINGVSTDAGSGLRRYYLSDGTYGSLHDLMLGLDTDYKLHHLALAPRATDAVVTKLFGPTCDSLDEIYPQSRLLAPPLEEGDFIVVTDAGSYTSATRSKFNFISSGKRVYVDPKGSSGE